MEEITEAELSVVTATLDLRLQDFFTATKEICGHHSKNYENCNVKFSATVFPNGADEDWISVHVLVIITLYKRILVLHDLKWAVSIIDIEGRTMSTRYFNNSPNPLVSGYGSEDSTKSMSLARFLEDPCFDDRLAKARYIEKSFIRSRADEILSDGTLFLRCDIYFNFDALLDFVYFTYPLKLCGRADIFITKIPYEVSYEKADETGNFRDAYTVFDLTFQILTLPQFHELRKRFGVYGRPPVLASPGPESKEDITDILEYAWIFDTRTDRFLLSLAPNPGNVGHLLVDASPVIKKCIESPMKEKRDKRVKFPDVNNVPFLAVLHFLKTGEVLDNSDTIVEVYKFSHLYELKKLQRKCAEFIMSSWVEFKTKTELEEIEKIAEMYSDDYLFGLLQSSKRENFERRITLVKDYRPNLDFYN